MGKTKIVTATFLLALAVCIGSALAIVPACNSLENFDSCCSITGMTLIKGKIYEGSLSNGIRGANVTVACYHEGSEYTKNAVSFNDGKYIVVFKQSECEYGDNVAVSAEKNGMTGTNDGIVNKSSSDACFTLNVGIVNVPLIPEFGIAVGTLTAISAIGVFFLVRRK